MNMQMEEGLIILIVGMGMVFAALVLLFLVFGKLVPAVMKWTSQPLPDAPPVATEQTEAKKYHSGEEMAAVAAAVYLYLNEIHDEENAILTISRSPKNYSPWSSRIYATHSNMLRRGHH